MSVLTALLAAALGISPIGAMEAPRAAHTATLLPSGQVLIAGGCSVDSCELDERGATTELFDPGSGRFRAGPRLSRARVGHTATALRDGTVLVAGGWDGPRPTAAAELYVPEANRFVPVGSMTVARGGARAVLLRDGRVLVIGGVGGFRSADLYDPKTKRFVPTGRLAFPRGGHDAVLLRDGRVLVVGGDPAVASTEVWSPRTRRFSAGPRLLVPRHKHAAAVLRDGSVLVVGGSSRRDYYGRYASAELLRPGARRFVRVADMAGPRYKLLDGIVVLPSGEALVASGGTTVELYDPERRRFRTAGRIGVELAFATATLTLDGRVLVAGGYDERLRISARAWLLSVR